VHICIKLTEYVRLSTLRRFDTLSLHISRRFSVNIQFLPYPLHKYMFGQDFAKHLTHSTAVYMFSTIVISYTNFQYLVDRIVIFITSTSSLFLNTQEHYVQINIRVVNGDCKYNPRFIRVRRRSVTSLAALLLYPPRSSRWYQMYRKMGRPQRHYQLC
jgi:hypothetical protein